MSQTKALLSTRELAEIVGVSESSIKRWVDEGRVGAQRTAGGHRRIPLDEAVRFLRGSGLRALRPDLLGIGVTAGNERHAAEEEDLPDLLFEALLEGNADIARSSLTKLYLEGASVAAIVDGPLARAMERIGELWLCRDDGIFLEHRATDIVLQVLRQLRSLLPPPADGAPVALGGAPADDPYSVASLAAALLLEAEGFAVTHLGPQTPVATLVSACGRLRPKLVWISMGSKTRTAELNADLTRFAHQLANHGTQLALGGRALDHLDLPKLPTLHPGRRLIDLETTARQLRAA